MKKGLAAERNNDSGVRTALGTLLIEQGIIDGNQLEEALRLGTDSGERLGEVLVRMGWASEEDLARVLAHQWNLRCLERSAISFDPNALAKLSREDATTLEALPMRIADDGSLVIAVAEPTEARLFALRSRFGDRIECVVIPKTALDVGLRGDLLAKTSPSRRDEKVFEATVVEEVVEEEQATFEPALEPAFEQVAAVIPAAEDTDGDVEGDLPPAALAVVDDFDATAGALTSLVDEQLASLRQVVLQAEQARTSADHARTRAEGAQAHAETEAERLRGELTEREGVIRDLQQTLRQLADKLLPPPSSS